jgi:hypothetical protein
MSEFEWLKDEKLLFIWVIQQCIHTFYHFPMYAYISGVLHIYKKQLKDVFIQYGDRYEKSNILFIDEGQYHLEDNNKENCLKMPSSWTFDGSDERDRNIKTMLCSLLNHLGPHPNMMHWLKTFKFKRH